MIQAVNSEIAIQRRKTGEGKSEGGERYRTDFIGLLRSDKLESSPQIKLVEMGANTTIHSHFHRVDQFLVFLEGSGTLGRNAVSPLTVHYTDHHTPYGPIDAGPVGLATLEFRAQTDPGAVYLRSPDYKHLLKPTKKRYLLAENILLSCGAVLEHRREIALEPLFGNMDGSDGLSAFILRLGAGMRTTSPEPRLTGGQVCLVVNGSLELEQASYKRGSLVYAGPTDAPLQLCAGSRGLEMLILNCPRRNA